MTRHTVQDEAGTRYLVEADSGETLRVRHLRTGELSQIAAERVESVGNEAPLVSAARTLSEASKANLGQLPEHGVGLLVELRRDGPIAIRTMLATYDLCESDLHGVLAELTAAGLVQEEEVAGQRGYTITARASEALE